MTVRRNGRVAYRRARACVPMATRVVLLLVVIVAAAAPAFWAPDLGARPVLGAHVAGNGVSRDQIAVAYQAGNPTATPTVDAAALPIDTATPTMSVPVPPPPPPPASPSPPLVSPTPYVGDPCWGDEQITYSPSDPRANNEMIIVVTSARPHPYGRIAGTEKATFVRERPGQLGYVWEWSVALTWPGKHEYTFYVDSTIPCKSIEIQVRRAPATATPTSTPDPDNENSDDDDEDDEDEDDDDE